MANLCLPCCKKDIIIIWEWIWSEDSYLQSYFYLNPFACVLKKPYNQGEIASFKNVNYLKYSLKIVSNFKKQELNITMLHLVIYLNAWLINVFIFNFYTQNTNCLLLKRISFNFWHVFFRRSRPIKLRTEYTLKVVRHVYIHQF